MLKQTRIAGEITRGPQAIYDRLNLRSKFLHSETKLTVSQEEGCQHHGDDEATADAQFGSDLVACGDYHGRGEGGDDLERGEDKCDCPFASGRPTAKKQRDSSWASLAL